MKTGIYQIRNLINEKRYIGQSKYDIDKRVLNHRSKLRFGKHENEYLQHAFNKYGEQNFEFRILEYCGPEDTDERERHYIELLQTYRRNKGYNIESGGNNFMKVTKELRARKCGEKNPMYGKHQSKEFCEFIRLNNRASSDKLTVIDVGSIKKLLHRGARGIDLAKQFNVDVTTISKIRRCSNWTWVLPELNNDLLKMDDEARKKRQADARELFHQGINALEIARRLGYERATIDRDIADLVEEQKQKRLERNNEIIQKYKNGWTPRQLMDYYNLSPTHTRRIILRETTSCE